MYLAATHRQLTEIGSLPNDWRAERLGNVSTCVIGLTYSPADVVDQGTLVLRSSNIQNGRLAFTDCVFVRMTLPDRVVTREGDLLVCVRNGSRSLIGKAALIDSCAAGSAFGAFMSVLRSNDGPFLRQVFDTATLKRQIEQGMGATINQITNRDMDKLLVPWPSNAAERSEIGSVLTTADTLIDSLEQLLTKKRQIKQGAMQELLTGKRRLEGFHQEWRNQPFDAVLERINVKRNQIQASEYQNVGTLPVVDQGQTTPVAYSDAVDARFKCPTEGVLIFGDHTCITKFVNFDFVVGADGVQVLVARQGQNTRFHAYQLELNGIESTGYNRHFKFLLERSFLCPAIDEQTAIAQVLSDMDAEISALDIRLTKARALKQAMAQALLTGRIRLVEPTK